MACSVAVSWLADKVRRLFRINELIHYQGLHHECLQRLVTAPSLQVSAASTEESHTEINRPIESLIAALGRVEALGRQWEAFHKSEPLQGQPATAPNADAKPSAPLLAEGVQLDAIGLMELEKQGLFILGGARSGTSVLTTCFNRAPEIFMLEEPNSFMHEHVRDFAAFFNDFHPKMGNRPYKGTYVPPPAFPEYGPLGLYHRLRRHYRYVGEKVAIGPHAYPVNWKRMYLDFQARYFLRSFYFLTIRTPNEALWSMHKLFPSAPIPKLFTAWLDSLTLVIDVYRVCPNSHLLFFNNFGPATLERLAEIVGVNLPVPASMVDARHVLSSLDERELPGPLAPYSDLCSDCTELFQELQANVCPQGFRYKGSLHEGAFFAKLNHRIQALLDRADAESSSLHAAA
jgi:hypothetical protein